MDLSVAQNQLLQDFLLPAVIHPFLANICSNALSTFVQLACASQDHASESCQVNLDDNLPVPKVSERVSSNYFSEWLMVAKGKDEDEEDEEDDEDDDDEDAGDEEDEEGDDDEGDDDEDGEGEGEEGEGDDDEDDDEVDDDDDDDEDDDEDEDDEEDESPPKKLRK
ncbi:hypothetical protein KP509_31G035900 [Ceratopteris richardii]|nr:hypothetical protein KP509_31G035900 [Ceratopteris richardii]